MANVFISYKKEERERAHSIAVQLEKLLVSTWLDAQLAPGQSFTEEIRRELDLCRAQIVCWSVAATRSEWVRGEAEIGRQRGTLVPAFIEACELFPPFNMLHAEDLIGWNGETEHQGWQRILRKLGVLLERPGLSELGRIIDATDAVSWRAWLIRFPGDPGEIIARKYAGDIGTVEHPTELATASSTTAHGARERSITELTGELEVADFRLRVFRDAAKKFGWKDAKDEQRLELEVAALREAITTQRATPKREVSSFQKNWTAWHSAFDSFVSQRTPLEQIGIAGVGALAAFAVGFIFLAALSIPIQMVQPTQEDAVRNEQAVPSAIPAASPQPFDIALLGEASESRVFEGEFEGLGLDPTWAIRFSEQHATLAFRDGAAHSSYDGQRETRSRGTQTIYNLGEPLAVVLIQQSCSLSNGVITEYEVHVRSNVSTYTGCAERVESEHWPPWSNYGSAFWRFRPRPFDD